MLGWTWGTCLGLAWRKGPESPGWAAPWWAPSLRPHPVSLLREEAWQRSPCPSPTCPKAGPILLSSCSRPPGGPPSPCVCSGVISWLLSAGPWLWGTKTMDEPRTRGLQVWGQMALSKQLGAGEGMDLGALVL